MELRFPLAYERQRHLYSERREYFARLGEIFVVFCSQRESNNNVVIKKTLNQRERRKGLIIKHYITIGYLCAYFLGNKGQPQVFPLLDEKIMELRTGLSTGVVDYFRRLFPLKM